MTMIDLMFAASVSRILTIIFAGYLFDKELLDLEILFFDFLPRL